MEDRKEYLRQLAKKRAEMLINFYWFLIDREEVTNLYQITDDELDFVLGVGFDVVLNGAEDDL